MGYSVTFQYIGITVDDQIGVIGISITLDIYNFFVLETFKIFSPSYFEIFN